MKPSSLITFYAARWLVDKVNQKHIQSSTSYFFLPRILRPVMHLHIKRTSNFKFRINNKSTRNFVRVEPRKYFIDKLKIPWLMSTINMSMLNSRLISINDAKLTKNQPGYPAK